MTGGTFVGLVSDVETPRQVPGFRVVAVERRPTYTLVRYRADAPRRVPLATLMGLALTDEQPGVLLQHPGARADDGASIPE